MLFDHKKSWDSKFKYALWVDNISMKNSIETSHFHLVYGKDVVFHVQIDLSIMKLLQAELEEPNDVKRRVY